MAPWKLPLLVAAIAVPIVAAFMLGGGGVGVAAGALVTAAIIVIAVRQRPQGPIGKAPTASAPRRLLLVVDRPLEDAAAIAEVAAQAEGSEVQIDGLEGQAEVLVLAPASIGFLDRWASDLDGARREAQQRLVVTVASLAKAGIAAEARVGDEDPVQAVEDAVGIFAATEVVLVTAPADRDPAAAEAAAELERRLRARFRWLVLSDPPTG